MALPPKKIGGPAGRQNQLSSGTEAANASPSEGGQYYGLVKIDAKTGALKVQLKDLNSAVLYEKKLVPQRA